MFIYTAVNIWTWHPDPVVVHLWATSPNPRMRWDGGSELYRQILNAVPLPLDGEEPSPYAYALSLDVPFIMKEPVRVEVEGAPFESEDQSFASGDDTVRRLIVFVAAPNQEAIGKVLSESPFQAVI